MWKRLFNWRRKIPEGERLRLEAALDDVLQPIMPSPKFVDGLQRTLMNYTMAEEKGDGINQQSVIVVLAGFFSAALLLSIGIRTILTFIGAIGVIQYHKRQMQRSGVTAPLKTAG